MKPARRICMLILAALLATAVAGAAQETSPPAAVPQSSQDKTKPEPPPAKKLRAAKPPAASTNGAPKKIVVREGGADEPMAQIVTGMSPAEAERERREAELLLSTTAEKLKEIAPRQFNDEQQQTISQIHNYMEVSRSALKEGDIPRAHTLAIKAGLLADDLARH